MAEYEAADEESSERDAVVKRCGVFFHDSCSADGEEDDIPGLIGGKRREELVGGRIEELERSQFWSYSTEKGIGLTPVTNDVAISGYSNEGQLRSCVRKRVRMRFMMGRGS